MPEVFDIETIFRKYKDKIYRLALSISRNDKDAEDIVQNTFLKIIKNLSNFRNESRISTWIYKIAYNETLMVLRKKNRQFRLSSYLKKDAARRTLGLFINWSKLPDKQLLDNEFKERLDNAIKQMPIQYRMPLLLNNVEGLSLKDSAHILGLRLNSLKTRLHRARLMIKSELVDYFKDRLAKEEEKEDKRCNILLNFVYDYAQGSLDNKRQIAFSQHIEDCPNCKLFLDTYVRAISITQALECQDLPDKLKAKIETFIFKKH